MSNEENSSQNSKDCIAEAIRFLMNKQIFAWLLQYLVPEYHNLPIDLIAKQISCIKEYKNRWYDLICEMPIRGKKGGLVLFIAGSKAENDRIQTISTRKSILSTTMKIQSISHRSSIWSHCKQKLMIPRSDTMLSMSWLRHC